MRGDNHPRGHFVAKTCKKCGDLFYISVLDALSHGIKDICSNCEVPRTTRVEVKVLPKNRRKVEWLG